MRYSGLRLRKRSVLLINARRKSMRFGTMPRMCAVLSEWPVKKSKKSRRLRRQLIKRRPKLRAARMKKRIKSRKLKSLRRKSQMLSVKPLKTTSLRRKPDSASSKKKYLSSLRKKRTVKNALLFRKLSTRKSGSSVRTLRNKLLSRTTSLLSSIR